MMLRQKKLKKICTTKNIPIFTLNYNIKFIQIKNVRYVEIAGQQFKAEKGRKLYVHRLQGEENSSISFDKVLLTDNDGQVKVGAPVVEGASVKCKILRHLKDDKVIVFKKKRRTGYQKQNGHRQCLTQILIEDIVLA